MGPEKDYGGGDVRLLSELTPRFQQFMDCVVCYPTKRPATPSRTVAHSDARREPPPAIHHPETRTHPKNALGGKLEWHTAFFFPGVI